MIMNYEKKYKEALERMKSWARGEHPECFTEAQRAAEFIFPELKESEDERIRKELVAYCQVNMGHIWHNIKQEDYIAWLEKQGEQKPADNFKQKFKVGDWVTNGLCAWRIDSIDEDMYYTNHCGIDCGGDIKSIDEEYHIWTIQDAKDGDVLACNEEILLFKSYSVQGRISLYCWYNGQTTNFHSKGVDDVSITTKDKIYPATKEQRELLFKKMHEAGFEWDAEKKELNKFHVIDKGKAEMDYCFTKMMNDEKVSSTWSEEDTFKVQRICKYLDEAKKYYADITEVRECMDWLKSLKDRVIPQPRQEWSKEDERILDALITSLNNEVFAGRLETLKGIGVSSVINWLKSIKHS